MKLVDHIGFSVSNYFCKIDVPTSTLEINNLLLKSYGKHLTRSGFFCTEEKAGSSYLRERKSLMHF